MGGNAPNHYQLYSVNPTDGCPRETNPYRLWIVQQNNPSTRRSLSNVGSIATVLIYR